MRSSRGFGSLAKKPTLWHSVVCLLFFKSGNLSNDDTFTRKQSHFAVQADFDYVWPEQQSEGPINHNTRATVPTWHLQ